MTTLPQTTSIRVPRQAGPTPLTVHAPAGPLGPTTSAHQMTGGDVWRVIRSNIWLILGLLLFSGGAGYGVNYYLNRYHASYTAAGYVMIQPIVTTLDLKDGGDREFIDNQLLAIEQKTHASLLAQEALFARLLQNPDKSIRQTEWFKQFKGDIPRAKEDLEDHLSIRSIPETKLVAVAMSWRIPRDCRIIVEDIINQHLEEQRDVTTSKVQDRGVMLNGLKRKYEFRLNELSNELREKSVRLSIDGMGTPGRLSAKELELGELLRGQFEMQRNSAQAKSMLESMVMQQQNGVENPNVTQMVEHDPDVMQHKQLLSTLDYQLSAIRIGPGHRQYQMLMQQREAAISGLETARARVRSQASAQFMEEIQQQVAATENTLLGMQEKINQVKADMGDLSYAMATYLTMKDEEEATRALLKGLDEQLAAIGQIENAVDIGGVTWARHPETPDRPSFPKLEWSLTVAILIGLALGLGIAFLRELLDTSVRSPRDIARVGQLNLLGMIPHEADDPQSAGAALPTVIFQAPHSMLAEQFRQVRTRLQHSASLDATRTILVTSPGPGDGKTTVACNLAAGLALNGRRILLVDANFRRPEIHKLFGLGNEVGLSTVLNAVENFETAVVQTQVPNLDVLPSGPKPGNPTELLESQLLIDFIERALQDYDNVIFDSGPLLFISETVALAPRVDGVVSVVRARTNSRGLLQRMRDTLKQVRAENLGVILNAVRSQAGGYYNRNMKAYYAYQNGHEE